MADKKPVLWNLADVKDAVAVYFDGHLILSVSGKKPTPCYRVRIEQSPLAVETPTFVVEWQSTGGPCPEVITPYQRTAVFSIGVYRETVDVVSAEGTKSVKVKKLDSTTDLAEKAAHRTATGYSATFSFEDAFEDAIGKLPPLHPDELQHFVVTNTGAVVGGFLGLRTMFVTVRTP
ncbi:MAG TPA: hypothetical protein VF713_04000 [Thermoanaerobaculia bacterium]